MTFSLQELQRLEDERLAQQQADRQARAEAERRASEDSARREREALEARERRDAEERERARRAELEDLARREAMQKAIVEQARLEVEVRARTEERERERRHEIELAHLRAETAKRQPGARIGAALVGAGAVLGLALVAHFAIAKPAADRHAAQLEQDVAVAESRADELGRRVDEQKASLADLQGKLSAAQARIAELERTPVRPTTPTVGKGPRGGPVPPKAPKTKTPEGPCINEFDPLCPKIGGR